MVETVTIGDQDVQITETEDGFEATAVEDNDLSGLYLRTGVGSVYGCEIPIDADFRVVERPDMESDYEINFHDADNISDKDSWNSDRGLGYDSGAYVSGLELIEY